MPCSLEGALGPPAFPLWPPWAPPVPPQALRGPLGALLGCLLEPPGLHWLVCCPLGVFTQSPGGGNIIILHIFPMKTTYFWIAQNDQNDLPEVKRASLGPLLGPPCFTERPPWGPKGPPENDPKFPGGALGPPGAPKIGGKTGGRRTRERFTDFWLLHGKHYKNNTNRGSWLPRRAQNRKVQW